MARTRTRSHHRLVLRLRNMPARPGLARVRTPPVVPALSTGSASCADSSVFEQLSARIEDETERTRRSDARRALRSWAQTATSHTRLSSE